MKSSTPFSLILLCFLFACNTGQIKIKNSVCPSNVGIEYPVDRGEKSICVDSACQDYLTIWKEIARERNGLSEDFFDSHIDLHFVELNEWNDGTSLRACYYTQVDWAIAYQCDQFIVNVTADSRIRPHLDIPRNVNLTKEQIELVIEDRAFSSKIRLLKSETELAYSSIENAMDALIDQANVSDICFDRVGINRDNGNLTLYAFAEYLGEENLCMSGQAGFDYRGDKCN